MAVRASRDWLHRRLWAEVEIKELTPQELAKARREGVEVRKLVHVACVLGFALCKLQVSNVQLSRWARLKLAVADLKCALSFHHPDSRLTQSALG